MSQTLFAELHWLPPVASDFDAQLRGAAANQDTFGATLRSLATARLDVNQLSKMARVVRKARASGGTVQGLANYRLAVVTNSTPELLVSAIEGSAPRIGLNITCVTGGFGQALQETLDPRSVISTSEANAVLIALDWRGLPLEPRPASAEAVAQQVENALQVLRAIRSGIRANLGVPCIVQNLAPPAERVYGSIDRSVQGSLHQLIDAFNVALDRELRDSGDVLLDVAGIASTVGLANWHSPAEWNLAKLPFASDFLPLYADHVLRTVAALTGRSKRCLVMDLDNTLWGGVIGDDGLAGISLAQGDAVGEAYLELQRYILSLRDRGVALAVSSKNTDEVARAVFREHPEMLLREPHIAVFQANWNDKATNIVAIARELSLGLESLVFIDDNPFERTLVRRALPQVTVVELPEDPALYARTLSASGYFEIATLSDEDLRRASFYDGNAKRAELQKSVTNLDEYLASLDMEIIFQPFDAVGRNRISQLINKSNQFNLTTRRYSELDVESLEKADDVFTLQVRLIDKFGDNGMISVIVCRRDGEAWLIDTWLMSCRVLGRRVEQMVLRELMEQGEAAGVRELLGTYIPTEKNALVKNHYRDLGFELVQQESDGKSVWRKVVNPSDIALPPMKIRRSGFEPTEHVTR